MPGKLISRSDALAHIAGVTDPGEKARIAGIQSTYGADNPLSFDMIFDPKMRAHYEPIALPEGIDDNEYISSHRKWNSARARWNDLSDSDRTIAIDEQKMSLLDYEKRRKEKQDLSEVSRKMDQWELKSKSIGSRGGRGTILTGGSGSYEPDVVAGAKTKLGL